MKKQLLQFASLFILTFLIGCGSHQTIVNQLDERDANEIVVFLASKGITAHKVSAPSTGVGTAPPNLYSIEISSDQAVNAMAILNRVGLPRRMGTTLLQLFTGGGLIKTATEEMIRYQAGLAEELQNTIRKIDGVIDANVQLSFPPTQIGGALPTPGTPPPKVTAAVFIKHQGILEDPNSHLEMKIKRLLAGSINGLNYDDVSVISDRSRLTDITLSPEGERIGAHAEQTQAMLWGLVMSQNSIGRFRLIFFTLIFLFLLLCAVAGWIIYKFYPQMRMSKESASSEKPPL